MSKKLTKVERWKEPDGTYEVTFTETARRKLTTKDELIPIIAQLATEAQNAVKNHEHLLIGEKDVYLAFAHRFISYLEHDPKLFDDFLADVKEWPRAKKEAAT